MAEGLSGLFNRVPPAAVRARAVSEGAAASPSG